MTSHATHATGVVPAWPVLAREHAAAPVESSLALLALGRAATMLEVGTELLAVFQHMPDLRLIIKEFFFGSGLGLGL